MSYRIKRSPFLIIATSLKSINVSTRYSTNKDIEVTEHVKVLVPFEIN